MNNKVKRIEEQTKNKIDIFSAKGKAEIEKSKVTNEVLKNKAELLETEKENIILTRKLLNSKKAGLTGNFLMFLAFVCCIASTLLSLVSGYQLVKGTLSMIALTLVMIVTQSVIYLTAAYNTRIKEDFYNFYDKFKLMQYAMLFVSISLNIRYFYYLFDNTLATILISPLCFILDYSIVLFSSLGYNIKNHITHKRIEAQKESTEIKKFESTKKPDKKKEVNTIIKIAQPLEKKIIGFNMDNNNYNTKQLNPDDTKELRTKSTNKESTKLLTEIEAHIKNNYDIDSAIETQKIQEEFNINRGIWTRKIKNNLDCIEVRNKKCYRIN